MRMDGEGEDDVDGMMMVTTTSHFCFWWSGWTGMNFVASSYGEVTHLYLRGSGSSSAGAMSLRSVMSDQTLCFYSV